MNSSSIPSLRPGPISMLTTRGWWLRLDTSRVRQVDASGGSALPHCKYPTHSRKNVNEWGSRTGTKRGLDFLEPDLSNLELLKKVGGLLACFFGVVDRDLGGFLGSLGNVFAGVGRSVAGHL